MALYFLDSSTGTVEPVVSPKDGASVAVEAILALVGRTAEEESSDPEEGR